jgi:hypothetical protein
VIQTLEGLAVLIGIPALVGFSLPRGLRRGVGVVAAIAATVLWVRGINVHGPSAPAFFILCAIAFGAVLREFASLAARARRSIGDRP